MIVTTHIDSKFWTPVRYDIWLNGGKVKSPTYADDVNDIVEISWVGKQRIHHKIRRGKVKIVLQDKQ